jgi:DNA-binding response OmpR family regulator
MAELQKAKILYIEDDLDIAGLYQMRMEMEGFEVKFLSGGEGMLEEGKAFEPDLILLDLMLPKVDGATLLQQFRGDEATKSATIIVLSAIGEKAEIERIKKLGADEFVVKSQMSISDIMQLLKTKRTSYQPNAAKS